MKKQVLTISVRRWLNGNFIKSHPFRDEQTLSALYAKDTKRMCCMGFECRRQGLPVSVIKERAMPSHLPQPHKNKVAHLLQHERELAKINDNFYTSVPFKKRKITEVFKKMGITVRFVP